MQKIARRSAILVAASITALLSGCSDKAPSTSTIKKQIAAKYAPCKLMSVEDFEKINGYPQNDGTYIASVKYTLVLTPSDKMVGYVRDFEKKEKKISQSIEDDKPRAQEILSKIESMRNACKATDDQKMSALPHPVAPDPSLNIKIMQLEGLVKDDRQRVATATASMQPGYSRYSRGRPTTQAEFDELAAKLASDEAALQDLKTQNAESTAKFHEDTEKFVRDRQAIYEEHVSCDADATAFAQKNADILDPRTKLVALNEDGAKIEHLFNEECPLIAIGGVMYAYFDEGDKHAAAYAKELKKEYSGNARFIKSDNGWVMCYSAWNKDPVGGVIGV